jgi:hypothetical protein
MVAKELVTARLLTPATSNANPPMAAGDQTAMGHVPTIPSHVMGPIGQAMMVPVVVMSWASLVLEVDSADAGSFDDDG